MRLDKKLSISFKIIFLSSVLAAIFLGSSFFFVVQKTKVELIESAVSNMELETTSKRNNLDILVADIQGSLLGLKGTPPFQGIIRARENNGFDVAGNSTMDQWQTRLETIFSAEMEARKIYDQLRYLDETGQELVRVNFVNGTPAPVEHTNLQYKGNRDYFIESLALNQNEIYVSNTELNKEGTPPVVTEPVAPTIRYASPIFDNRTGEKKGIIIANIRADRLIEQAKLTTNLETGETTYIIDTNGFFIHHPDGTKTWGGPLDRNTGISFDTETEYTLQDIISDDRGTIQKDAEFLTYARLSLHPENSTKEWVILKTIPSSSILGPIEKTILSVSAVGIIAFIVLFFVFLLAIKKLLKPLDELALTAEKIGNGNFSITTPVHSEDEIGKVAQAFNNMTKRLKTLYGSLESQVAERTHELDSKVEELKNSQHAVANVLEDIGTEKEKLETILESIGDAVFVVDVDGTIKLFNQICADLSGYTKKYAIGKSYKKILAFRDASGKKNKKDFIEHVLKEGHEHKTPQNITLVRKDGSSIDIAHSASPLKDYQTGETTGAVVVFRDVTKEREIDKAKTEFVSLASHQLRTPLTSINWYAELLLSGDGGKLTKKQQEFIQEVYDGNRRMVDLVNALLNVSRIELGTFAVDPEKIDIKKLGQSIVKELTPMTEQKKITIKEIYKTVPKTYTGDEKLLNIILQNLLSNAVKYTPENGKVSLSIHGDKKKKTLHISVKDTGYGIPKKDQPKIFQKLFRADNVQEKGSSGTGLGLYIVKSIVKTVGGEISFTSAKNKGTTFTVDLPLTGMKAKKGSKPLQT